MAFLHPLTRKYNCLTVLISYSIFLFMQSGCKHQIKNHAAGGDKLYIYSGNMDPRWSSPENRNGQKGNGGKENNSAKGHAYDGIAAGGSFELLNINDRGIINRIWVSIDDRSP